MFHTSIYIYNIISLLLSQYFLVFICFYLIILISVWLHFVLDLNPASLVVGDVKMEEEIRTVKSFDNAL